MKVVIVGGGFGGLRLARKLNNKPGMEVVLLDRFNYHQFQPLFYQVATAGLDASNISFPLRKVFHKSSNVRIRLGELKEVLPEQNKIVTDNGELDYDALVIATGAGTNFFGNQQLQQNAFAMKSTLEALQIRNHLIQNFENASIATDAAIKESFLTVVVVGGGPTGVEVSGAIADMRSYVLPKDYPELDFKQMKIYLLEGSPRTLAAMTEASSEQSRKYLEKLGVEVITGTVVKDYDGNTVTLANGNTISTKTVIWAAGIKGNVPTGIKPELVARGNRIITDRHNRVQGTENIYAIGDVAYMETPLYPKGHPQVAQVALQQADTLVKNLLRTESKSALRFEFEYYDKGSMATVGRNLAVVDLPKPKLHFGGFFAWLVWMLLHLMLILGVKNRFFVFSNWVYNYFTRDQSLRLIIKGADPNKQQIK
ncbi:MAG: NAD(P)/FAD-dependent oxidoreductase [Chitinophagaceae bacterium]